MEYFFFKFFVSHLFVYVTHRFSTLLSFDSWDFIDGCYLFKRSVLCVCVALWLRKNGLAIFAGRPIYYVGVGIPIDIYSIYWGRCVELCQASVQWNEKLPARCINIFICWSWMRWMGWLCDAGSPHNHQSMPSIDLSEARTWMWVISALDQWCRYEVRIEDIDGVLSSFIWIIFTTNILVGSGRILFWNLDNNSMRMCIV